MRGLTRRAPSRAIRNGLHGLTLVEMLATLAVIAILAALAMPSFQEMLVKARLRGAVERIHADFQWTKSQAIKTGRYVSISFRIDAGNQQDWCYGFKVGTATAGASCDCRQAESCWLDENLNGTPDNGETGRIVQAGDHPGISIVNTPFQGTESFGWLQGTAKAGNVTLASGTHRLRVRVNDIGRIRICAPPGSTMTGYPTENCD